MNNNEVKEQCKGCLSEHLINCNYIDCGFQVNNLYKQLLQLKAENEKLKEDKITKEKLRIELNYQCEVVQRLKEEMEEAPLCVQSCKVDCEIKQLRAENEQLTQKLEMAENDLKISRKMFSIIYHRSSETKSPHWFENQAQQAIKELEE